MGKYLKLFETHSAYNTYINSQDKILPNVSYCEDNNEVHYNPWTDPKLVCKYNITDTTSATALRTEYEQNMFKSMEIDGVLLDSLVTEYQFDTTGEHTVKYELYDETKVGNNSPIFNQIATLTSASIPNSVTTIGNYAFYNCSGLTSVTIPDSLTTIGNSVFFGCTGLTSVTIPNSVTTVGEAAFCNCIRLTSITIPSGVTSIGISAFQNCAGLTSITIPNSITSIGNSAFNSCSGLTSITVDGSNTLYDSRDNCNAIIETASNTLIAGCKNTIIPNTVTSISADSFNNCIGLTNITIPDSVTSIAESAFNSCSGLTSVTIPNSVTNISFSAFYGCTGLTSITSLATTAPTIKSNTFQSVKTGGTLTVPSGSSGYDTWMGTGNYYLGKYGWTKVE